MYASLPDAEVMAPPVVVVMVTCVAGDWLEESLASLAAQDYPNFSVLVIDASGDVDPTARVATTIPTAYVRRLDRAAGYASAANEVLGMVEGASHFLFCHDDVALAPDALRLLVEEAFRSNAGIVTPKLVEWGEPDRLLQVGMSADKLGTATPLVDRGELDQEQHDAVRDVFVAPGGCLLVRADLFTALGGFDSGMTLLGEDVDLSWRVQVAGARVVVAPAARVRHLEALTQGLRSRGPTGPAPSPAELDRLHARHRLRAMLKDYGILHSLLIIPQALLATGARVLISVVTGNPRRAGDAAGAWIWNLRRLDELHAGRRGVRAVRALPDGEVRRLQVRGSAAAMAALRAHVPAEWRARAPARALPGPAHSRDDRLRWTEWALAGTVLVLLFLIGARHLVTGALPAVGQLARLPSRADLVRLYTSGWRPDGVGSAAPAPAAFGLLGLASTLLAGATGFLQKVIVLGAIPVGVVGVFRLLRPLASDRARLAGTALYALLPVAYNALANGHLGGLGTYAAAPWMLAAIADASELEPFHRPGTGLGRQVLRLALLTALVGAFVPAALLLPPLLAGAVLLGCLPAGGRTGGVRALLAAALGSVGAFVLLAPWSFDLLRAPGQGLFGVAQAPAAGLSLGSVLRFASGPVGTSPLTWAFLIAAALPIAIGRQWRLGWSIRMWAVALTGWGLAWAGGRGWVPNVAAEVLLAPVGAALALIAGLGVLAFDHDLPAYRFGWRQVAPFMAMAAAAIAILPTLGAATNGRWYLPTQDINDALGWMPERQADGAFRVLWVGDPRALPLAGWRLQSGMAYATSEGGVPDARNLWPPSRPGAAGQVVGDLTLARAGQTTRLGHLLAPLAIRYLVLPLRAAPGTARGRVIPPPSDLQDALATQIDLRSVATDPAFLVYENTAWGPGRALLPSAAVGPSRQRGPRAAQAVELAGALPVLANQAPPAHFGGRVPEAGDVYLSETASSRWQLTVAGRRAPRRSAFGWASAFAAPAGPATLTYRTPLARTAEIWVVLALWIAGLGWLIRAPRRLPRARS
jgi:GT2 family glycosyltransferase